MHYGYFVNMAIEYDVWAQHKKLDVWWQKLQKMLSKSSDHLLTQSLIKGVYRLWPP